LMPVVPGSEDLKSGLDVSMHGARAYKEDSVNGGKSAV